jgi:TPR repeat protein
VLPRDGLLAAPDGFSRHFVGCRTRRRSPPCTAMGLISRCRSRRPKSCVTILPQAIMSKVKVLFFAADPLSAEGAQRRLLLDREAREIKGEMVAALHRDRVEFVPCEATRLVELRRELLRIEPQIVHFSGHGGSGGLVLEGSDGRGAHRVDAAALKQFFSAFRGQIRVVVLNACHSQPQAEAIAEAVGCAIGTPSRILDEDAITFSAAFYSSIAFGQSVQAAFDQACATLKMKDCPDDEVPHLVVREGLDASQMFPIPEVVALAEQTTSDSPAPEINILPPERRRWKPAAWALACGTAVAVAVPMVLIEPIRCAPAREVQRMALAANTTTPARLAPLNAPASDTAPDTTAQPRDLLNARKLHQQGDHAGEFTMLRQAAEAGHPAAMRSLGIAYLEGEGTSPQPDSGVDWLQEAVKKGDVPGMAALADAYRRREGVTRDSDYLARHWYERAAVEGHAEAMFKLANMYRDGEGGAVNDTLALEWFEKAARAGYLDAMVGVGYAYDQGLAVPRNEKVAMCWYRAAADAGSPRGKVAIGIVDDSLGPGDGTED